MRRALTLGLFCLLAPLAGCGPKLIPGTEIEDTDDSRALLDLMETYRRAVEGRNVDGIMKLVHPRFFDDGGTPEGGDDVDLEGLRTRLSDWAVKTKAVRIELQVKRIVTDPAEGRARFFYDINFQVASAEGPPRWERASDSKEMLFKKDQGAWKIASGL